MLNGTRNTGIFFLIFILSTSLVSRENSPPTIHLVYTGNLNCALDDCRCGGDIAGGFTRIITVLDSLRTRHPDLILVDAGDQLSSYSLPEANRVMAALLSRARYTALNLGDQEFVESTDYLLNLREDVDPVLPYLSTNIFENSNDSPLVNPFKKLNFDGMPVTIFGVVDPGAFEFIHLDEKIRVSPLEKALEAQQTQIDEDSGMHILLFHGRAEKATKLMEEFPWIDIVVLSHNQVLRYDPKEERVIVESGAEGEYIGHLQIKQKGNFRIFQNEFIPVYYRIPPEPAARQEVEEYYQRLMEIQKRGTSSKQQD
jgi:2',3'-cyclic-nucleotide 2'-phosphodiesterase (5'-nucleotidase family)